MVSRLSTAGASVKPTRKEASLRVVIRNQAGAVIRTVEFPDPRIRFCKTFNEDSFVDGLYAELLDLESAK